MKWCIILVCLLLLADATASKPSDSPTGIQVSPQRSGRAWGPGELCDRGFQEAWTDVCMRGNTGPRQHRGRRSSGSTDGRSLLQTLNNYLNRVFNRQPRNETIENPQQLTIRPVGGRRTLLRRDTSHRGRHPVTPDETPTLRRVKTAAQQGQRRRRSVKQELEQPQTPTKHRRFTRALSPENQAKQGQSQYQARLRQVSQTCCQSGCDVRDIQTVCE